MRVRARSVGVAATAVALLLSGCTSGDDGESAEQRTVQAMRQVLKEYQPRFEQRRAALDAVAASVPEASPAKPSCDREPDPEPTFYGIDSHSLVVDSYNSPDKGGNVEALQVSEAAAPESMEDRPARSQFILEPGWFVRGLWITGAQGPLGTDHFTVDSQYGYEPYDGVEKDPVVRLRKILDIGLHKRYVVLYRVTSFGDPDPDDRDFQDIVTADAFLADLEKRDLTCRFVATGRSYDLAGTEIEVVSGTPYEDMQTTFQLDIDDKLRELTGR